MNRFKLVLFIVLLIAFSAHAQFFKQVDLSIKRDLHTVTFSGRHGWAVSYGSGNLYHSADNGKNWSQLWSGDSLYFEEIQFTSEKSGYLVGESSNLLYSKDGGRSWHNQLAEQLQQKKLLIYGAYFSDSKNGIVSCQSSMTQGRVYNLLLQKGKWQILTDSVYAFLKVNGLNRKQFLGCTTGEIICFDKKMEEINVLYKRSSNAIGLLRDVGSVDDSFIYAIGARGYFIHSIDGGATWKETVVSSTRIRSILFIDNQKGYIVGDQGLILGTEDGGLSWIKHDAATKEDLHRVVKNGNSVWICGKGGTLLTNK